MNNEEQIVLAPASVPQEQFLSSTSAITLYAGAMGAGKTFAIVLNMVKFAAMQNSTIVCFRRTMGEMKAGGGIWQEAVPIFRKMFPDCKVRTNELEIYIPSTNSFLKFQSLQHQSDVDKALGAQYSAIFFDEAVTFPFDQFIIPLLGRLRNAKVKYMPQMFWATNPKFDHGIYHWIKDFYLDEYGIPLKEKSNIERWFVLQNNKPVWFDTKEEALVYCDTLPAAGGHKITPRSFRAIRAHVTDNEPLLRADPNYLSNLQALPTIRRRIYLDGSWVAKEEEAGYFKREWCEVLPFPPDTPRKKVRVWDQSSTLPSSAVPDPDWTRGSLVSKDSNSFYTVEDIKSLRDRPHKVEELIIATAKEDGSSVTVVLAVDPGAAGVAYANSMKARLAEMGFYVKLVKTNKSKLTRFLPFSSLAEAGRVRFCRAEWLEECFGELEVFSGTRNGFHDDICDTLSDAVLVLNQTKDIPIMTLPNLTMSGQPSSSFSTSYGQGKTSFSLPTFNIK